MLFKLEYLKLTTHENMMNFSKNRILRVKNLIASSNNIIFLALEYNI